MKIRWTISLLSGLLLAGCASSERSPAGVGSGYEDASCAHEGGSECQSQLHDMRAIWQSERNARP